MNRNLWFDQVYNVWQGLKKQVSSELNRRKIVDLSERYAAVQASFSSPLGEYIIQCEEQKIASILAEYRGKRILHLSAFAESELRPQSAFHRVERVYPLEDVRNKKPSVVALFDQLPFDEQHFDLVLIQHALEYSKNPQQLLKEAARVTDHGGHVVIFGFNPLSTQGLWSLLWGRVRPTSFWLRRSLLAYRVKDWLKFVDFNNLSTSHLGHVLPISHAGILRLSAPITAIFTRLNLPFSSVYCLVSRKDKAGFTLLKPDWKRVVFERAIPKVKPSPSVTASSGQRKDSSYNIH